MLNDLLATSDKNKDRIGDARSIMRLRVEIMEHFQVLDLHLLGQLGKNPAEVGALRVVCQHIKWLKEALRSLKLILGGDSVLGSEIKNLGVLFQYLYECLKRFLEQCSIVSEAMIQISSASLHLLSKGMRFPESEQVVVQSIGELVYKLKASLEIEKFDPMKIIAEVKEEVEFPGNEQVSVDPPADRETKEEFAQLLSLLDELMMSKGVFDRLSRQALLEYDLPLFSQEIKATGNRLMRSMNNFEDSLLRLSHRYTKLMVHKRKVLPFVIGGQAFFLEVKQVLEVLKIPRKTLLQRGGQFFCPFRGETIGFVCLSELLGRSTLPVNDSIAIIVISDGQVTIGLGVEKISMAQDVLVKPLPELLAGQREIAGAAIMEGGRIGLMLDGVVLIQRVSG